METEENNKLIAEFMGYERSRINDSSVNYHSGYWINKVNIKIKYLNFHSSWDWLMPVIEKINNSNNETMLNDIHLGLTDVSITYCYDAIVLFIKWYNENIKL